MLSLKSFRKKVQGVADLLKYAALIEPDIVLNKDGSFMTMYRFTGKDTDSSTNGELNFISEQVNRALMKLGDGWTLHLDAIRTADRFYPNSNHFPDAISAMIDQERHNFFKDKSCYKTDQYLTLTFLPDYSAEKLLASASGTKQEKGLEAFLKQFKQELSGIEDTLASVINIKKLKSYIVTDNNGNDVVYSDFLSILNYIITGVFQPIRLPDTAMYLDSIIASQNLTGGVIPQIGDLYIKTISIDGLPNDSYPAMLSVLEKQPFEFRFNTRFMFLGKRKADKMLESEQKGWNQKVSSLMSKLFPSENPKINLSALNMALNVEDARNQLEDDAIGFGYLSTTIVLMSTSLEELETQARGLRQLIEALGFGCRIETINTIEAWLGSHPANTFANLRRPLLSTKNLAHILPLATVWHGRTVNPCPFYPANSPCLGVVTTAGDTPLYLNLHVDDIAHTFICGATGSGKSTLLGFLASQFLRYKNAHVFAFDKSLSMKPLANGVGGLHFDIGKSDLGFAPLTAISDAQGNIDQIEFSWATEWVENLIKIQLDTSLTPNERSIILDAMRSLALHPVEQRSLTHLYNIVRGSSDKLATALKHYTKQGNMGHLLDAKSDGLAFSFFTVFEIETLMELHDNNKLPVLLYLFHRIEKSFKGDPALLIIDEAWIVLQHPLIKDKIEEWLRMLRKANCGVVLATQQLTEVVKSGILDIIMNSCLTKIYLPNPDAVLIANTSKIYTDQGLNARELEILAHAIPKREYYLKSPEGNSLINLKLLPKSLAFIGNSDKDSLRKIEELQQKFPETWTSEWMRHLGIEV